MAASLASLSSSIKTGARPLFNRDSSHRLPPSSHLPLASSIGKLITSCSRRRRSLKNIYALETSDGAVNVEVEDDEEEEEEEACELVNRAEVSIDGVEAHLLTAVKNNNGTGLLLLSDIFGFQDSSTSDFAYRVACNGYNVLVPDLFRGDPWSKNRPESEFEEWRRAQDPDRIRQDTTALTKWMVDEFAAAGISKKLGVMGFCFGGGRVVDVLAADKNGYFSTGVSFYGTRMDSAVAGDVKVPVLFIAGDRDPLCQVEGLKEIEEKIGEGSKVVVFEGRGHGFVHRPETPEDDRDAEEAFAVMRNWLHHHLLLENK
uniref:Carboxymethylenebutenolidase homolog n=1 Tax=Noccaea caerulescens TaxID=107243 RepID=A0A1J3CFQ2_NOCCA